ncbi:MAG: hypothetical protein HEP71_26990 [Roseivirga sp.]|nr:hypothetical protein [Roseivirga sp.]
MGLDIYHEKATLLRPRFIGPGETPGIIEDEFSGFDVPFSYFDKFIQKIDCGKRIQSAIIVDDPSKLDKARDWFKNSDVAIIMLEDGDQPEIKVKQWAVKQGFDKLLQHTWRGLHWKVIDYYELEQRVGFYTDEVGYQRKGMNAMFWEHFGELEHIYNFTSRQDFEYALTCVDFYWEGDTQEEVEKRKLLFKKTFVDQYKKGESILSLSY